MSSEDCVAHPVGYRSPLQITNGRLAYFFFKFELAGSGVGARCRLQWLFDTLQTKISVPNGHYYLQLAAAPNQITQQNSLQRLGGPLR
jgi:hypothetical protein